MVAAIDDDRIAVYIVTAGGMASAEGRSIDDTLPASIARRNALVIPLHA
jgi:hypothetical protein